MSQLPRSWARWRLYLGAVWLASRAQGNSFENINLSPETILQSCEEMRTSGQSSQAVYLLAEEHGVG